MDTLTLLPQRPDGVRATLEFVFSVHPSSAIKNSEAATAQKQGANITMEALKMASNLIAIPPTGVKPEEWYPGIAPQLLTLLEGSKGEDLAKVAAYVIGFGVLGRRQFGAPGTAGWKTFAEPMLAAIDPSLSGTGTETKVKVEPLHNNEEVVDLTDRSVLVKPDALSTALLQLSSLLSSHPNPGLAKRLLGPLLVPLWVLSTWKSSTEELSKRYQLPAKSLLEVYLRLSGSTENFTRLLTQLLAAGSSAGSVLAWRYETEALSGIQVKRVLSDHAQTSSLFTTQWDELESKTCSFVELLSSVGTETDISAMFLTLLQKSFAKTPTRTRTEVLIKDEEMPADDPTLHIIESNVLQKMMEIMPDKLVSDAKSILTLSGEILAKGSHESAGEIDTIEDDGEAIALSLLNLVVTTPNFQVSKVDPTLLASIEKSLDRIKLARKPEVSQTAYNLSLLLKYRDQIEDPTEQVTPPTKRQVEDRKTYQLAMQYITQADSPPPVRSEGINLLSKLIQAGSPILDIPATLVLLSSLLAEDEDYTTLRVMKLFTQIADKHAKSTIKEVLEHYVDASESATTDTRLRFGETMLQIIQRLGEAFTGPLAQSAGQTLLSVAGRRIHRPETQARHQREDRLKERQQAEAAEAWGGNAADIPDLSEAIADTSPEEKARNRLLAQIIEGWELPQRKEGGEDIRMRASALSVFSVGIETNIAGYGPDMVEAGVDLAISILTSATEQGMEAGILRRAAVILILSFVKALAGARENGRRLGFGLTDSTRENISDVLRYVAEQDTDGLAQQHARDCLESLDSWRLIELMPTHTGSGGHSRSMLGIDRAEDRRLASVSGLTLDRPGLPSLQGGPRPRIEEIE